MNNHKKLNLIKSFETYKLPRYRRFVFTNHHTRFNLLGDLFFNATEGKYYVDHENGEVFTFSSWDNLDWQDHNDLEQIRRSAPSNQEVLEWCNSFSHNRWAQMRKLSRMKSNHLRYR